MSNALRKCSEIGTKDEVACFLCSIIGGRTISFEDVGILCSHVRGNLSLRPDALTDFLSFARVIDLDAENQMVSLSSRYVDLLNHPDKMIAAVVSATLDELFAGGIITGEHFSYDSRKDSYTFNNEWLALEWSSIRNLLISCDFLRVRVEDSRTVLEVSSAYEEILSKITETHHRKVSLENLKARILENEEAGEIAEQYALAYEKRRIIDLEKAQKIKRISMIDVCAGYDIVSFEGSGSEGYDRLVEVKAVSQNNGFYWSKNEMESARLNGVHYHLCLVDLGRIDDSSYEPYTVADPATVLANSEEWLLEPQSFFVRQVLGGSR
jgi:hypothetical protein